MPRRPEASDRFGGPAVAEYVKRGEVWAGTMNASVSATSTLDAERAATRESTGSGLTEAFAEGLHKAMCFGPATLHNRLACERPLVYLSLAEAALAHPAVTELLSVAKRSSDAAFGALGALANDLDDALRAAAREGAGGLDVGLLARAQAIADGLAGGADELDHGYAMTVAAEYARLATAQKETPDD